MINAGFGEYKLWLLSVVLGFFMAIHTFLIKKNYLIDAITKLFLIGLFNFCFFLTFPTSEQVWIMVSSFRYSLTAFIPLILATFLLTVKYKKEEFLAYFAIANMINVLSMVYYPKLIIVYFPLFLLIIYLMKKKKITVDLCKRIILWQPYIYLLQEIQNNRPILFK